MMPVSLLTAKVADLIAKLSASLSLYKAWAAPKRDRYYDFPDWKPAEEA